MFSNEEVALKELEKWCRTEIQSATSTLADGGAGDYPQYCGSVARISALGDVVEEIQEMIRRFRNGEDD